MLGLYVRVALSMGRELKLGCLFTISWRLRIWRRGVNKWVSRKWVCELVSPLDLEWMLLLGNFRVASWRQEQAWN